MTPALSAAMDYYDRVRPNCAHESMARRAAVLYLRGLLPHYTLNAAAIALADALAKRATQREEIQCSEEKPSRP